jgi:hypothetical protein
MANHAFLAEREEINEASCSEMRNFFAELGRTSPPASPERSRWRAGVFTEAYIRVRRRWKPAENDAQQKKSHF